VRGHGTLAKGWMTQPGRSGRFLPGALEQVGKSERKHSSTEGRSEVGAGHGTEEAG
jgi:hypothetical protein